MIEWSVISIEKPQDPKKIRENEALEEVKNLIRGKDDFHGNIDYTIWLSFGLSILAFFLIRKSSELLLATGSSVSKAKVLSFVAIILVIIVFVSDLLLFYFGQIAFSSWLKDGSTGTHTILFLFKFISKSIGIAFFACMQIGLLYRVLQCVGSCWGGRTDYSLSSAIWILSIIVITVLCLFFPIKLKIGLIVFAILFGIDFVVTIIMSIKTAVGFILSFITYAIGLAALCVMVPITIICAFWAVVTAGAVALTIFGARPPKEVGGIRDNLGSVVGKVYDDGTARLNTGKEVDLSKISKN